METGGARSEVELTAPPGFVSHTAFILKKEACTDFSAQETYSLEDMMDVDLLMKKKPCIVYDQLEHHEVPAQRDPDGACTGSLEEATVFQSTGEGLEDTLKYIESICQEGLSGAEELDRDKRTKALLSDDKLLLRAAHEAVKASWEVLVKQRNTPLNLRWRAVCGKSSVIAKMLKARVRSETLQRKYLCTDSQKRKMDKYFNKGEKRTCWHCHFNLYMSASFCPCNPTKYSCLKHTKHLCSCGWTKRVFLYRLDTNALNTLVAATEGSIDARFRWLKHNLADSLEDDTEKPIVHVIPDDTEKKPNGIPLLCNGEKSSSSVGGTSIKDTPKKLLSESMARIWKASPVPASHINYIQSWKSTLYDSDDDSSSASDDERYLPSKRSKPVSALYVPHSTSNGKATGHEKEKQKQEMKSSGKMETIICLSSDDEG